MLTVPLPVVDTVKVHAPPSQSDADGWSLSWVTPPLANVVVGALKVSPVLAPSPIAMTTTMSPACSDRLELVEVRLPVVSAA
jgi:hypothetical protein